MTSENVPRFAVRTGTTRGAWRAAALAAAVAGGVACGEAPATEAGGGTGATTASGGEASARAPRLRPSQRGMAHAFERVASDGARCLRAGDPAVTVRGAFTGATGAFAVSSVAGASGAPVPYALETCVRVAAERAHVRAFRDARAEYEYTFGPAGGTAGVSSASSASSASNVISASGGSGASTGSSSGGVAVPAGAPTLQDLIDREGSAFHDCYAREALARDHRIAGSVEIHLVLEPSGQIARLSTTAHTTYEDPQVMELVGRCMEQRVRAITFPAQRDAGREYTFPVHFTP